MTRLNLALLALLPSALAVPRLHNRHEKHHHPSGLYPTGAPIAPTGGSTAPYGYGNGTSDGPTGTGTGSPIVYSTVTVSPVPISSNGAISGGTGGYGGGSSYGAGAGSVSAVNGNAPVSGNAGTGACGPATVTVTSANTITVTVGAGGAAGSSNAATSDNAAATNSPISPISTGNAAPYGNGTSTDSPIGTGTAPIGTASRGTGLPIYSGLPVYSGKPAPVSSPVASAPVASTVPTSLNAYSAPEASAYVAPVAASSNAAVSASSTSTSNTPTAAAFFQKPSPSPSPASSVSAPSPVAPSPVAPVSSSSSSSAPSTGGVKARGLAYQNAGLTDLFQTSAVGWGYNWGQTAGSLASGVQYVPMLHDNQASSFANWQSNAQKAIDAGSTHLLAFNEPEQPPSAGGCQMSVQQVIDGWNAHMAPFKGKAKLGSPAVTSQEGSQTAGLPLLSQYLSSFGADVDFICIHWYGTDFSQFKQHISDARKVAGSKPIWLTEFAHNDPAQAASFMAQALPWLDNPANGVERYAYQFVDTTLTNGQSLSAAGQVYNGKA